MRAFRAGREPEAPSQDWPGRYPEALPPWGESAYRVRCPDCGAPAGRRCVYLTTVRRTDGHGYPVQDKHAHEAGEPTVNPHMGRRDAFRRFQLREVRKAQETRAAPVSTVPPSGSVPEREALSVACPQCGAPAGMGCRYVRAVYWPPDTRTGKRRLRHRKGTRTEVSHAKRREAFAHVRLLAWRRRNPALAAWQDARAARLALGAYDRAEAEALRDWLAGHGHILWEQERPDGTVRGGSYAVPRSRARVRSGTGWPGEGE